MKERKNMSLGQGLQGTVGAALTPSSPKNKQLTVQQVENGFAITENFNRVKVYLDIESMIADLKTYFIE